MTNLLTHKQRENIGYHIKYAVRSYNAEKEKFIKQLDEDPAYAMEWSAGLFVSTGKYEVAKHIESLLKSDDMTMDTLKAIFLDRIMQQSGSASRSTSITSNIVEDARAEAYKQMYKEFNYI